MEIVFLARKSHAEADKLIQFETVWGLPAKGAPWQWQSDAHAPATAKPTLNVLHCCEYLAHLTLEAVFASLGARLVGEVEFIEDGLNTTVLFRFEHQMPALLVDLKVRKHTP